MTMIERVARAIGMTIPNRSDATYVTPYTMLAARAAIEAMKTPTDAMADDGYRAIAGGADAVWQAMIDKALEE